MVTFCFAVYDKLQVLREQSLLLLFCLLGVGHCGFRETFLGYGRWCRVDQSGKAERKMSNERCL